MVNNRRIARIILDAARAELASRLEKLQLQIMREERFPHIKYFHKQNVEESRPLQEYLEQDTEAHAAALKLLNEIDEAEAEDFGKTVAEYLRQKGGKS